MQLAQNYLKVQVNTTSQEELVVLIFEAAIKYLEQAKEKIKEKDYARREFNLKALDCIAELDSSLNMEKGGEIAKNLHALYFYCQSKLLMANLKLDCQVIDEVIGICAK